MSDLFKFSKVYKPFTYPWADKMELRHNYTFWHPEEAPLDTDVTDWNNNLTHEEQNLLTHIFRFFTQADVEVATAYNNVYMAVFKNAEIQRMMSDFSAREGIHVRAYARLLETVGMPSTEYNAFMDYKALKDKHEFLHDVDITPPGDVTKMEEWDAGARTRYLQKVGRSVAVYSAFTEGMMLFSSFAILLNFKRLGKMNGMGQIVAWSQRDESLHVEGMIGVFRTLCNECPEIVTDAFKKQIYQAARDTVELEDKFIDLAFEAGGIEGLEPEEVKQYIRHIADRRLVQLGLKPNYGVGKNPLPWVDMMVESGEHANFFEQTATAYTKGGVDWD